jgi:hypothetical protein
MAEVEAKGIEKLIVSIVIGISKIETGLFKIVYGSASDTGILFPGRKKKTNGLLPIVREVNAIDLCNVIQYSLNNVKLTAPDGEEPNGLEKKVGQLKDAAKKVSDFLDLILLDPTALRDVKVLQDALKSLNEINRLIDRDIVTLIPQAANIKNYILDLVASLTQYPALIATYTNYNNIPDAEVQKILKLIQDVRSVCGIIAGLGSVGDLTRLLIPNEIQELQKIISPAYLLPIIRKVVTYSRAVNQQAQKVIGYVNILKVIVKIASVVLKVLEIILKFFGTLPLPGIFTTHGITDILIRLRQAAQAKIVDYLKRLEQIAVVIDVIYGFSISLGTVIDEITRELEILQFNLESCEATNSSPAIEEIKQAKAKLRNSKDLLDQFNTNYNRAKDNRNVANFNGYVIKIEEEELTDIAIKYKRRRAVVFDDNGVLVLSTQLTFATDITILFEEARLMLINSGLVADLGYPVPDVSGLTAILDIPTSDTQIYNSVGLPGETALDIENKAVQGELTQFIFGLPGGDALRNKVRSSVSSNSAKLNAGIKSGAINPTSGSLMTGGLDKSGGTTIYTGEANNGEILSDEERDRLRQIVKEFPTTSEAYRSAKAKLEEDREARQG